MEYLIKVSAILVLFYLCYKLLLNRETFFESNRSFLLLGLVIAFILPLITITKYVIIEPPIIKDTIVYNNVSQPITAENSIGYFAILAYLYIIGILFFLGKFLFQFGSLTALLVTSTKQRVASFIYVLTKNIIAPFSFFNWIVFNPNQFDKVELEQIIAHEKVHARQLHSIDILIAELICIILWFNPLAWLYKKELRQNLEYIADKNAQEATKCKKSYQHLLLKTSVPNYELAITNNFYNSLIKKRIVMLHKNKSKNRNQLKFLLVLPALVLFLMSFNTNKVNTYKTEVLNNTEIATSPLSSDVEIIMITKRTSNDELKDITKKYEKRGIQLKFKSIKRNEAGEITSISISAKTQNSKVNYNTNDDIGINPIKISIDADNNQISVGDSSHDLHFSDDESVGFVMSSGKSKNHKSKKGSNVFVYSDSKHEYEEEVEHEHEEEVEHEHEEEAEHEYEIIEDEGKIIIQSGRTIHELKKQHLNKDKNVFVISGGKGEATYDIIKADTINAKGKIFELKGNVVVGSKGKANSFFVTSGKNGEVIELKGEGNEDGDIMFLRKDEDGNIVKEKIKGKGNTFTFESKDGTIYKSKKGSSLWISKDDKDKTFTKIGKNGGTFFVTSDGDENPLIVINGKEVKNKKLKDIDPDTIKSVSVLKGESAEKKYGKKGKDGVIEITTKKNKN